MKPENNYKNRIKHNIGFSLFELLIAMPLVVLIILGTSMIYILSSQMFARTTAQLYTSMDSSNAIQYIISQTREAQTFALPTENTFVCPSIFNKNAFSTTYNGETICTAVELNMPPTLAASQIGYQAGNPTQISVINTAGNTVTLNPQLYFSNGASSQQIIIYRGDPPGASGIGAPDANPSGCTTTASFSAWKSAQTNMQSQLGTYLWEYNVQTGVATVLCKSVAWSPNAVQFIRPTTNPSGTGTPLPFELEVNVVSGYYSPINFMTTNEESNGSEVSSLSGKCVYMRDHQTAASAPTNANTSSTNNAIQYSP